MKLTHASKEAAKTAQQEAAAKDEAEKIRHLQEKTQTYLAKSPAELHEEANAALERAEEIKRNNPSRAIVSYEKSDALDKLALAAIRGQRHESQEGPQSFSAQLYEEAVSWFVSGEIGLVPSHAGYERAEQLSKLAMKAQRQEAVTAGIAPIMDRMGVEQN